MVSRFLGKPFLRFYKDCSLDKGIPEDLLFLAARFKPSDTIILKGMKG